jgi:hypothetical protein
MISETTIRSALVAIIAQNDSKARVYRRIRFVKQGRIEEFNAIYRDEDGIINCYMVRRLRRRPNLGGVPQRLKSVEFDYEIRFRYGMRDDVDVADGGNPSEEIAQANIDSLAALFEADNTLGLGACVSHTGLGLPGDFEDRLIGDWVAHAADLRLTVKVANVNC